MNTQLSLFLIICFLAFASLLGPTGSTPASAAGFDAAHSAPLLAHWSDLILHSRARMIQATFIIIIVGIFILRRS